MSIIKSTSIKFESGLLLSKEILEQMDIQSHLFKVKYETYPDGIIYGLEPYEKNARLYLSKGLIKFNNEYYFSVNDIDIYQVFDEFDYDKKNKFTGHSVLAFTPINNETLYEGINSKCLKLGLFNEQELPSEYLVIAKFQYHNGKREWENNWYNPLDKLEAQLESTGYYFTFLDVKYSMPNENVFSPYICSIMKECIEDKKIKSSEDFALLFILSQNKIISFDVLNNWFKAKNNTSNINMSDRKEVISKFLEYARKEEKVTQPPLKSRKNTDTTHKSKPVFGAGK